MESAAVDWFEKDQIQINKVVNTAWKEIERLWLAYEMQVNDFEFFSSECPKHMARIDEIVELVVPPMAVAEIRMWLGKWVKNYEYVFQKRNLNRRKINVGRSAATVKAS